MSQGLHSPEKQAERILVEGSGGQCTPLLDTQTYAEWVMQEQLPVLLVVGVRLGYIINHAIFTADAVQVCGLRLAGWIANDIEESPDKYHLSYISTLKQRISALFLGEIPCCLMQHSAWTAVNL